MAMSEIEDRVRKLLRPATLITSRRLPRDGRISATATKIGGTPYAESGDEWPLCESCERGLAFIMQVNMGDVGPEAAGGRRGLLVLHLCARCWPEDDDGEGQWSLRWYESPTEGKAVVLKDHSPKAPRPKPCSCAAAPVLLAPDWDDAEKYDPGLAELCAAAAGDPWEVYERAAAAAAGREGGNFGTIFGGYPAWVQGDDWPECAECGDEMELLLQMESDQEADLMWGDAGCLYVFVCPRHRGSVGLRVQSH